MDYSQYEAHNYTTDFPLNFHLDTLYPEQNYPAFPHWHEHLEILYIINGICATKAGDILDTLYAGDLILFSPNCPHDLSALNTTCEYYCITIDHKFCIEFGIPIGKGQFSQITKSGNSINIFLKIVELFKEKPQYYRQEIKALCLQMLAILYREHDNNDSHISDGNNTMIAKALEYINIHYVEPITVEEISKHAGFSKYYFCRSFKKATGMTLISYINSLRCTNAKRLIQSGQHNIGESAVMSGFNNLSYFSRIYKKHIGHTPSEEKTLLKEA